MEGLVKIGKTTRDPAGRANELSKATGVPTPFILIYHTQFEDCSRAEEYIHTLLQHKGYRIATNREFFNIPINDAIDVILETKQTFNLSTGLDINQSVTENDNRLNAWEEVYQLAEDHYYGLGDTLQDEGEALKLYKQAIILGSSDACLKAGKMCMLGEGCTQDYNKALEYFKEGAQRSNYNCYAEMATLYALMENADNARKCWEKFVDNAQHGDKDVGVYFYSHISNSLRYDKEIIRPADMAMFEDEIMGWAVGLWEHIDKSGGDPRTKKHHDNVKTYLKIMFKKYRK